MVEYKTRGTPQSKNNMKNKKNFKKKNNTKIVENEAPQVVPSTKTKVHLMTQELKFVKTLAGNDALLRDKILKNLKKWLISRSKSSFPFTSTDFRRLWKGLFSCMWMSDKPLVQEGLADGLSLLNHCFTDPLVSVKFFGAFLETMCLEWFGIDQWRIDKFMMLVRRMVRQIFIVLNKNEWNEDIIIALGEQLGRTVLNPTRPVAGLSMHFTELYLEEVAKVSEGDIDEDTTSALVKPYVLYLATLQDKRLLDNVTKNIFHHLMQQSELGRAFEEKYNVWKTMGFPSASVNDLELVDEDELDETLDLESSDEEDGDEEEQETSENDDEKALDPRAGRVSVVMPEILFNANDILRLFEEIMYKPITNTKSRYYMKKAMEQLRRFANGDYPLGVQRMNYIPDEIKNEPKVEDKAKELEDFQNELLDKNRAFKKLNKKQKKKLLMNGKIHEILPAEETVEENENGNGWVEEEINSDKEDRSDEEPEELVIGKKRKSVDKVLTPKQKKIKKREDKKKINKGNVTEMEVDEEIVLEEPVIIEEEVKTPKKLKKSLKEATPKSSLKKKNKVNSGTPFKVTDEWDTPLQDGEVEFFLPSRKNKLIEANDNFEKETEIILTPKPKNKLLLNPFASVSEKKLLRGKKLKGTTPKSVPPKLVASLLNSTEKRVKIVLENNQAQDTNEYIKQLISSPHNPYDSNKKPTKSLLKPNLMPSPINPYYRKKIGFNLDLTQ